MVLNALLQRIDRRQEAQVASHEKHEKRTQADETLHHIPPRTAGGVAGHLKLIQNPSHDDTSR